MGVNAALHVALEKSDQKDLLFILSPMRSGKSNTLHKVNVLRRWSE